MPAWPRAAVVVALVALLLTAGPTVAVAATAPPAQTPEFGVTTSTVVTTSYESNTTYQIDMQAAGNATWTITVSFQLNNESQRTAFETVADRFTDGEYLSLVAFERASGAISDEVGRRMLITNEQRRTDVDGDRGRLVLAFTWTNFGYRESGQLHVDDVFRTDNRLFTELDQRERLIITRPDGYQFVSASTNIQNRTLQWEGPYTFETGTLPSVVFDRITPPTTTTTEPPTTVPTTTPSGTGEDPAENTLLVMLAGIVVVGLLAAVVYASRRREEPLFPTDDEQAAETAAPPPEPAPDTESEPVDAGETTPESQAEDDIDEALLSDEERVERLLEANGGRMKQANIVRETGWSNAKVSQLLSAMDEDGRIDKLRIGRENLISFPEEAGEES